MNTPTITSLPVVTAIIANYNFGEWIIDALQSVASQDYPNKQIVLVDDCSTDNTLDRVLPKIGTMMMPPHEKGRLFEGRFHDTPIKVLALAQNGKQARARNEGIKLAWDSSKYFSILDADDIWKPGRLSKTIPIMEQFPQIGALYTDYDCIHTQKNDLKVREHKPPYSMQHLLRECIVHSGCTISKAALEKVGLYDEECPPCEDYDLWIRIGENFMIYHHPECLCDVRITGKNDSVALPREHWENQHKLLWEKYRRRHNLTG